MTVKKTSPKTLGVQKREKRLVSPIRGMWFPLLSNDIAKLHFYINIIVSIYILSGENVDGNTHNVQYTQPGSRVNVITRFFFFVFLTSSYDTRRVWHKINRRIRVAITIIIFILVWYLSKDLEGGHETIWSSSLFSSNSVTRKTVTVVVTSVGGVSVGTN